MNGLVLVVTSLLMTDLPPGVTAKIEVSAEATPREVLNAVLEASQRFHFDVGTVSVETDRRWYATAPPAGAGAPLLELRRWPGDTVLAIYAVRATSAGQDEPARIPGFRASRVPTANGTGRWEGTLDAAGGSRPALWLEREIQDASHRLAAIAVPGDAGLGPQAVESLREELLAVFERVEVRPEAWAHAIGPASAAEVDLPELGPPPKSWDESKDPWQVAVGTDFTLGLPPGLKARRLDLGIDPPSAIPGGVLWFRGRFTDRGGEAVAVGDGRRAGYVADRPPTEGSGGRRPQAPVGVSDGVFVDGTEFDRVVIEETGASWGEAERWDEPGFAGTWLVFRLGFPNRTAEIALPVLEGRRSLALFWIPATWRSDLSPPAPPPVDPAERFGIRFERLRPVERKRQPLQEGWLSAPGFRVALPRGVYPVVSLRTSNGFPVSLIAPDGEALGTINLVEADIVATMTGPESGVWRRLAKTGGSGAVAVWVRDDGSTLFVAGDDRAVFLERAAMTGEIDQPNAAVWDRLTAAVELERKGRRRDD